MTGTPGGRAVHDQNFAAVLFDMDGLLVDTEPLWTTAEVELAERLGATWSDDVKARVMGLRLDSAVPVMLVGLAQVPTPLLVARTRSALLDRMVELFRGDLPARPGALDLLADLRAAGVPVALVSSSYRVLVDAVLGRLGLSSSSGPCAFDVTLAGDEVRQAKPHPEPYLLACARLGVDPTRAVVLEDSPAGLASGTAAGCAVVAVPSMPGAGIVPGPRTLVLSSLADVDLGVLAALVAR